MSVSIGPGAYALARIPCWPSSHAAVCTIPRIANLEALYAAPSGSAVEGMSNVMDRRIKPGMALIELG